MTSAITKRITKRSLKKYNCTYLFFILVLTFFQFSSLKIIGSEHIVEKKIHLIGNPNNPLESNYKSNQQLINKKLKEINAILETIDSLKNEIRIANGITSKNQILTSNEILKNIEVAGFFDLRHQSNLGSNSNNGLNFGQFEIGVSKPVSELISLEAAIAFNSEEGKFELGAGFIDFNLYSVDEEDKSEGKFWNSTGFMIGQFDMPFGIDYKCIAAPDRKLITPPLANEKTINCMNNFGAALYGETELFDFTFFASNGLMNNGFAFGGRVGVKIIKSLELGTSYLSDLVSLNNSVSQTLGADIQYSLNSMEFKGEYISADGVLEGDIITNRLVKKHSGYYLQVTHELEDIIDLPLFICLRYGNWQADFVDEDSGYKNSTNRITSGIGYRIIDGLEIRTEFHSEKDIYEERKNTLTLQIVASF